MNSPSSPQPCSRSGIVYYTSRVLSSIPGLFFAVTTRVGGMSSGPRRFLNLSHQVPTDSGAVPANRRRVFEAFGIPEERTVFPDQVHGDRIALVTDTDAGTGLELGDPGVPLADGLATRTRKLFLVAQAADCPLVAFADPRKGCLALVHSGRRGTTLDIAGNAVGLLAKKFGSRPANLLAFLAPSIGPCCYEVGPDVVKQVRESLPAPDLFLPVRQGKTFLDLRTAILSQLLRAGLSERAIEVCPLCTACRNDHFYSYRREGPRTGRFAAILGWRDER